MSEVHDIPAYGSIIRCLKKKKGNLELKQLLQNDLTADRLCCIHMTVSTCDSSNFTAIIATTSNRAIQNQN